MLKKLLHFIQYHNFFTIGIMVVFFGVSASFAANPDMRANILAQNETVRSVDNSYIINTDFSKFDMGLKIQSVVEDTDKYYVKYTYNTVESKDYVWQLLTKAGSMKVSKKELNGRDLGIFVADQLSQVVNQELTYLIALQTEQKNSGETKKVVAVEYSGLIGQFLSPEEKTFEGYQPVVTPTPKPSVDDFVVLPDSSSALTAAIGSAGNSSSSPVSSSPTSHDLRMLMAETVFKLLAQSKQSPPPPSSDTPAEETTAPAETPAPEPSPAEPYPTSAPEPTPAPAPYPEPTPAPAPEPTPTPTPEPTPSTTPEPTPTTTPEPTPTTTPEPTPTPSTTPEPTPTPTPTPEPTPSTTPEPTPEIIPTQTPELTPSTTPEPSPTPTETPAV